jgi:hypothetical protein
VAYCGPRVRSRLKAALIRARWVNAGESCRALRRCYASAPRRDRDDWRNRAFARRAAACRQCATGWCVRRASGPLPVRMSTHRSRRDTAVDPGQSRPEYLAAALEDPPSTRASFIAPAFYPLDVDEQVRFDSDAENRDARPNAGSLEPQRRRDTEKPAQRRTRPSRRNRLPASLCCILSVPLRLCG